VKFEVFRREKFRIKKELALQNNFSAGKEQQVRSMPLIKKVGRLLHSSRSSGLRSKKPDSTIIQNESRFSTALRILKKQCSHRMSGIHTSYNQDERNTVLTYNQDERNTPLTIRMREKHLLQSG